MLAELIQIYSWDVDFQREIQKGDSFEVAYERFVDLNGEIVNTEKSFCPHDTVGLSKTTL